MKHGAAPKNGVEIYSLQATSSFLAKFTKSCISDICFATPKLHFAAHSFRQARNQLGTPGGVKSFLRGAQIF